MSFPAVTVNADNFILVGSADATVSGSITINSWTSAGISVTAIDPWELNFKLLGQESATGNVSFAVDETKFYPIALVEDAHVQVMFIHPTTQNEEAVGLFRTKAASVAPLPPATGSTGAVNTPVVVNMSISVSPSGTIEIFGQLAPVVPDDIIDANVDLSASTLYSAENSLIEFWEPSSARGTRLAELATKEGGNWKLLTRKLANGIQDCLEGEIVVSGAKPFNLSKYSAIPEYTKVANFGELALRTYAHYTLGHIDATAAITNDAAFVTAMLSGHRYDAAELADVLGDDFSGVAAGTKANADIARSLVKAIAGKDGAAVLLIAEQVLGQDASRAMDADNNMLLPDKRQGLKFIAGDVIYMTIKLQTPEVVIASGQQVSAATLAAKYTAEVDYTLKITLI